MRFMIIDDELISRTKLLETLKPYGTCTEFDNGTAAIEHFKKCLDNNEQLDLITLDLVMPVKDGVEVLHELRQIEEERNINSNRQTKIIIVSSSEDQEQLSKAAEEGCDDFISKPFDEAKLIKNIENIKNQI